MTTPRVVKWLSVALLVCSPCLCCWVYWVVQVRPHDRFLRLLRGDQSVTVVRVTGGPVPRPFVLDDFETVAYLSDALRAAEPDGYVPKRRDNSDRSGPTLHLSVWSDHIEPYQTSFEFPNDERISGMTVFCELGDHYYFWVSLPQPIPRPLAELIAETRKQDRERRPK